MKSMNRHVELKLALRGAVLSFGLAAIFAGPLVESACTPKEAQDVLDVVPVIAPDVCKLAEDVPGMPGWVFVVCNGVDNNGAPKQVKFPMLASAPEVAALQAAAASPASSAKP